MSAERVIADIQQRLDTRKIVRENALASFQFLAGLLMGLERMRGHVRVDYAIPLAVYTIQVQDKIYEIVRVFVNGLSVGVELPQVRETKEYTPDDKGEAVALIRDEIVRFLTSKGVFTYRTKGEERW